MTELVRHSCMATGLALLLGLALDLAIGDPSFSLHPVRLLGGLAARIEALTRRMFGKRQPALAGTLCWLFVAGTSALCALALSSFAWKAGYLAGIAMDACILWASIAPTDLSRHALRVQKALEHSAGEEHLTAARQAVSMMVGRDVSRAGEHDIARACVESVAESCVDGIGAPIFWAALAGPWAAFAYRAINTMDSMFGHKNERYLRFGAVAARADDAANMLPARLGGLVIAICAPLARGYVGKAFSCLRKQRLDSESPNAGHPESAFAGALDLRLGGPVAYPEGIAYRPWLNPVGHEPQAKDITRSVRLMWAQTVGCMLLFMALRYGLSSVVLLFASA